MGLTIFDCLLIKHNKNTDNDDVFDSGLCSKVSIAARKQKKPGSRDHLDRQIYRSTDKLARGGAGIFIEDKKIAIEERLSFAAGEICFSFRAEGVTMLRAL